MPVGQLEGALDLAGLGVTIPPVLQAACPVCQGAMSARQCVDIVIDVCVPHGVWFDPKERKYFNVIYGDIIREHRAQLAAGRALDQEIEKLAEQLGAGGLPAARIVARRLLELERRVARLERE